MRSSTLIRPSHRPLGKHIPWCRARGHPGGKNATRLPRWYPPHMHVLWNIGLSEKLGGLEHRALLRELRVGLELIAGFVRVVGTSSRLRSSLSSLRCGESVQEHAFFSLGRKGLGDGGRHDGCGASGDGVFGHP